MQGRNETKRRPTTHSSDNIYIIIIIQVFCFHFPTLFLVIVTHNILFCPISLSLIFFLVSNTISDTKREPETEEITWNHIPSTYIVIFMCVLVYVVCWLAVVVIIKHGIGVSFCNVS